MNSIKTFFKKYAISYACYNLVKKYFIQLKKIELAILSLSNKKTELPSFDEAMSNIRKQRIFQGYDSYSKPIEIDPELDLTIIIPIYNSEKFLEQCLKSVAEQKTIYKYQVICVNDGSTDNSSEILRKYQDFDRFVIVNQENKGHSGARNTALKMKLGKYIMFIDSDDFISDGYVEKMLSEAYSKNADIVQSGFYKCSMNSTILDKIYCKNGAISSYEYLERFGGAPWGRIYRSELWNGIFYPEHMMFEDTIIFNLIFRRAKSIFGVSNCFYYYRIYGNNTLDKLQGDPRLLDAIWSVYYVNLFAEINKLEKNMDYYKFFLGQCSKHIYYRIKKFDISTQKSCFVILCKLINEYNKGKKYLYEKDDYVLNQLEQSFIYKDFKKWKICSEILKKTSG